MQNKVRGVWDVILGVSFFRETTQVFKHLLNMYKMSYETNISRDILLCIRIIVYYYTIGEITKDPVIQ